MNETLTQEIEALGFVSAEAFVRWQFTKYLLEKSAVLEAKVQVYKDKYACDYATFEKRFSPEHPEVFEEWDDSILWEVCELDLQQVKRTLANLHAREEAVYTEESIQKGVSPGFLGFESKIEDNAGDAAQ